MFDELTAGQYEDWVRYHLQFNIAIDKPDIFAAIQIANFVNAHKSESSTEMRPIDVMPWVDPYGDDDAFFGAMRSLAAEVQSRE